MLHGNSVHQRCASGLRASAFVLMMVLFAAGARGQTVNPSTVSFVPSPDHDSLTSSGQAMVNSYNFEIYQSGSSQPYTVLNLGKPSPGPNGYITVDFASMLNSPPLNQVMEGRVAAVGPGGTGESTLSNTFIFANAAPSVQLTSPANGSLYNSPASIDLAAGASDSDGTISRVDFYANGTMIGSAATSPYAGTWSNVSAGSYSITAVATDNAGLQTTSAAVSVAVQAPPTTSPPSNLAPSVSVTSPAGGSIFAVLSNVTIAASANDSDGTIGRVDFYVNGSLVGSDSASPYSVLWAPTSPGNYTITAVATDNAGLQTTSAAVSVKARRKVR